MRDLLGFEPNPQWDETRVLSTGRDDGPTIFPVSSFTGFVKKISFYSFFLLTHYHHSMRNGFIVNSETVSSLLLPYFVTTSIH